MKTFCFILMAWLLAWASFAESPAAAPDLMIRQAIKKFDQEKYQEGVDLLLTTLTNLPAADTAEEALIHYNLGVGYYRLSQPERAGTSFQSALRTPDINLQRKAYFNLGNAQYLMAQGSLNEGNIPVAFQGFQNAQTNFMQALRLQSDDHDAKVNYELSVMAQMRIIEMVAMAMARLQRGDQMVGEYKFVEAAKWFQEQMPVVSKALELEPEKKKLFETMTQRSTAVAEIVAPPPTGVVQ